MKKDIFGLLMLGACACGFTACSDDTENPYATESSIQILGSSLTFDAKQSTGSIHYSAPAAVTVTSSKDWCTAQLSGDSVIVNVAHNIDCNGRSASVVLRCGADSTVLAVLQNGVISKLEASILSRDNDDAATVAYAYQSNIDMRVLSTPTWLSASMDADSLYVDFSANATGHLRRGYVVYGNDAFVDSVEVFQADFDKDIAGTYEVSFYNDAAATIPNSAKNKTLSARGLRLTSSLTLPIAFKDGKFTVTTGDYIGTNVNRGTTYYVYLAFGLPNNYWSGYGAGYSLSSDVNYDEQNGTTVAFTGTVSGSQVISLMMRRFAANSFVEGNDAGTSYAQWYYPVLRKVSTSKAQASASPKE